MYQSRVVESHPYFTKGDTKIDLVVVVDELKPTVLKVIDRNHPYFPRANIGH